MAYHHRRSSRAAESLAETEEEELGVPPTRPCESWQKSFELIMTIAEREKATPKCPTCKGTKVRPQFIGFTAQASKKS